MLIWVRTPAPDCTRVRRFLYSTTWAPSGSCSAQTRASRCMDASSFQGRAASLTSEGVKTVMYHVKRTLSVDYLFYGRVDTQQGVISRHKIGAPAMQREGNSCSARPGSSDLKVIISNTGKLVRMLWRATAGVAVTGIRRRCASLGASGAPQQSPKETGHGKLLETTHGAQ